MYPFFYGANHQRKLVPISDKLIACQRNCHVVNLSTSFTFEFPRKPNQQEQVWDQSSFEGRETVSSYTEEMARRGAVPVTATLDILPKERLFGPWKRWFLLGEPYCLSHSIVTTNRSYARLRHMLKIHHQASFVRHLLKLSLPSWCFHVGILFILTAVGIGSR